MSKKAGSLSKKFISVDNASISLIVFFIIIFSFIFCCFINDTNVSGYIPYTPSSPLGNSTTDINVENEYKIITSEVGSSWMFDWGDGTSTDWIVVGPTDTEISRVHNWYSYGDYEVKVKHKNIYQTESAWSNPLTITVAPPADVDEDGWPYKIEIAYGTDPENPDDFPLDTDGDGTPDEDSIDGAYIGDTDDDNDGLSDELENLLGSNARKFGDITFLIIEGTTYCLVDTNGNGKSDVLYNTFTEIQTGVSIKNNDMHLDINGDGEWDYTYNQGILTVYEAPFEIPWLYVILGIIGIILLIIYVLFKKGILFFYEEEYIIEE